MARSFPRALMAGASRLCWASSPRVEGPATSTSSGAIGGAGIASTTAGGASPGAPASYCTCSSSSPRSSSHFLTSSSIVVSPPPSTSSHISFGTQSLPPSGWVSSRETGSPLGTQAPGTGSPW